MANLTVRPSYQFTELDIITVDKLNLAATPVVDLALETPVNDQNYWRNGNFYSSFWKTPAGLSCPVGVETQNASYWLVNPHGAAVTSQRSTSVPDAFSLFSQQIVGAVNVTDCSLGQQINADLSAVLRRACTVSGVIQNNSGSTVSPLFEVWTANAFNDFSATTLQQTVNLQTCPSAAWTPVHATIDLTNIVNITNGLFLKIRLPTGTLSAPTKTMNFSRLKFQIGELATEFVDDASLFVQAPSVDSTMLQDGCIARPTLFQPNVIPTSAYKAGSVTGAAIANETIIGQNLDSGTLLTTTAANFTTPAVNANVAITVTDGTKITAGLVLWIWGVGYYTAVSIAGNVVTAKNQGNIINSAPGTVVNSGTNIFTQNAVVAGLGFMPVSKAGDSGCGQITHVVDTVASATAYALAGVRVDVSSANASNDGYFPSVGFYRPGVAGKALGLSTTNRLKTVDTSGTVAYLLDTQTGVDTNSYQDGSITLQKLAQSLINLLIAPGTIHAFAGPNVPSGWLVCDGTAISRTTWSALFAAIGTYWGAGDNVSTFNLPNLQGRAPIGYVNLGASGITGRAFASLGGEESHTLSVNELASHNHGQTPHNHSVANAIGYNPGLTAGSTAYTLPAGGTTTGDSIANIQAAGGNVPHNTMMPFAVLYYIIKV